MGAGDYSNRVLWLKQSTTLNQNDGQKKESFTGNGYLWCAIDPTTGRRQDEYGAMETGVQATIRVRNFPALSALDRLQDYDGNVWVIESKYAGDNEIVCDCYMFDDLELQG